ncbi:uncharacterized protein J3R85_001926 [Psidium guajava]|nr:uncharacterized protein J3R85_001926 [Psidium guajava]
MNITRNRLIRTTSSKCVFKVIGVSFSDCWDIEELREEADEAEEATSNGLRLRGGFLQQQQQQQSPPPPQEPPTASSTTTKSAEATSVTVKATLEGSLPPPLCPLQRF